MSGKCFGDRGLNALPFLVGQGGVIDELNKTLSPLFKHY